ncbi:sensor histidine kinase KdpD [Leptolyngbya sp. FACHB-261]|uniref:sensor histidine kinase n=1 Tax=Leptolyngbya sp. FACHB-261 TaxID=2692806 RepID=UPI001685EA18|nr:HAMP domain-containing sensor histidine kinase [Leptolyngbya sp. FACHB-261]MBD2100737.1 HAMP domain-containing histidine kinase [Leptolyngbya sp. FACHB-261]
MESIKDLKHKLEQAELACRLLEESNRFKATFLARTSHELRSPLNGIIGMHQLILGELCEGPEEEREFLQKAHESSLKLLALLDDLIDVSKMEYGTAQLQTAPLPLARLLHEVQQLAHLPAQNRNLRLEVTLPPEDLHVLADYRRLKQVFLNLIDTAISQMPEGSIRVFSHLEPNQSQVQVYVEDQRPPLQESETQTRSPAKEPADSAGLNLALAAQLVHLMGGELRVLPPGTPTPAPVSTTQELLATEDWPATVVCCSLPLATPGS